MISEICILLTSTKWVCWFFFIPYVLHLYWCSVTNYHKLKDLKQHNLFSYSPESWKFKISFSGLKSKCQHCSFLLEALRQESVSSRSWLHSFIFKASIYVCPSLSPSIPTPNAHHHPCFHHHISFSAFSLSGLLWLHWYTWII